QTADRLDRLQAAPDLPDDHQLRPSQHPVRGAGEEILALVDEKRPDHGRLSQGPSSSRSSPQSVLRRTPPGHWGIPRKNGKSTRNRGDRRSPSGELLRKHGGSPHGPPPGPLVTFRRSKGVVSGGSLHHVETLLASGSRRRDRDRRREERRRAESQGDEHR